MMGRRRSSTTRSLDHVTNSGQSTAGGTYDGMRDSRRRDRPHPTSSSFPRVVVDDGVGPTRSSSRSASKQWPHMSGVAATSSSSSSSS